MNKDCKPFDNDDFIYPIASGIYSAREFRFYKSGTVQYAVSSYYKNGEEGVMIIDKSCNLLKSDNGFAFKPVSVYKENKKITFWNEYKGCWFIKSTLDIPVPVLEGDLIVNSACIDKLGSIYLACVLMKGYLNSNIFILKFNGEYWDVSERLNSEGLFCQRPQIIAYDSTIYAVWDGYGFCGYDIYCKKCISGSWSEELRVSDSDDWELKPSITVDTKGTLWIAWIKNTDVERNGVISKRNQVMMAKASGNRFRPVPGNDKEGVVGLDFGLLPVKRYFGYHGLRRNPQIASCENGDIALFWEMQRGEDEIWENVENGYFVCMFYDGQSWSGPYLIQDGGNCFTIDSSMLIDDIIHYAYRGIRGTGPDIKFGNLNVIDLMEYRLPSFKEWENWKPFARKITSIKDEGIFFGDMHCHSLYSPDAEGYPDELLFYARDRSAIDFCAITDNDIYGDNILTTSAVRYIKTMCDNISKDGIFQAYAGYEWTYHKPDMDEPENFNHRTVIFLDDCITIASRAESSGWDEKSFIRALKESNTMWHAHHGIFRILDCVHDANVEIVSAWSNNMEGSNTVHEQLAEGQVFGFMGGSDNHRFIPGDGGALTGVICSKLTKAALNEAFFERHNYATCGSKDSLKFSIDGCLMGESITVEANSNMELSIQVKTTKNIEYLDVICNGEAISRIIPVKINECIKTSIKNSWGKGYIYLKIKLSGEDILLPHNLAPAEGNYIYSSPIWINLRQ